MQLGSVAALWRYPVKSLAPEALARAELLADGVAGDRTRALIVATPGHPRAGKPLRGKEHHRLHTIAESDAAVALAAQSGIALDVTGGDRYFDAAPISLLFDSWLHEVETLVGRRLEPLRYRPNIYAHAFPSTVPPERTMVGATLAIGAVILVVVAVTRRCVTPTYDGVTAESDPAVLHEVAHHRDNTVGVYCRVERPGTIAAADAIVRL